MTNEKSLIAECYASQNFTYFDIETIPCQDPEYLEVLKRKVSAPASYKKPESIKAWLAENRDDAAKDALGKTSFDGGRGHVCTISWAKNDGPINVCHAKTISEEREVMETFFESFDPYHSETIVGHYVTGFDIPFLMKRAVSLGVRLPDRQSFPRDPKPWDKSICDTMTMWAGARDRISMDALCEILGIQGKGDFDGSQVAAAWARGEHDKIAEYCRDDVWRTREIHKRFLVAGF